MDTTLSINADLKFVEFILHVIDKSDDSTTVGEIRSEFTKQFGTELPTLLNQNFGIYRLIPLLLIREDLKNENAHIL